MERPKQFEKSPESEVWNAIAAFEEILAAMPDDRTALETLFDAYDHIGDKTRALEYLVRLANQVCEESDASAIAWVFDCLGRVGDNDGGAKQAKENLEAMAKQMGLPSPADMVSTRGGERKKSVDIASELSLAWLLHQAEQVTKDEYSTLVSDVTENSTKHLDVPVSVLHVMQDRAFTNIPTVLTYMSHDSAMPILQLVNFDLDRGKFARLPMEFPAQLGAISFDEIGGELLVAILNPYNEDLKKEVQDISGCKCHFYLVCAEDYDAYLGQARQPEPAAAAT